MPYIKKEERVQYENSINEILVHLESLEENDVKGHLNYIIFTIIKRYLTKKGLRYFRINDILGVLECCKLEVYLTIAGNYESQAEEKNGPIT
jgi:hypothetical protein